MTSSYACEEILFTDKKRDQTLFRVSGDASFYKKFEIKSTALNLDQDELFRISSMDESLTGIIHRVHRKCVLEDDNRVRQSDDGKAYIYANCDSKVIGGNSGSPVFTSEGAVFGVLWGANKVDPTRAVFTPLHPTIIRMILNPNQ